MKYGQFVVGSAGEIPLEPDSSVDLVLGFGQKNYLEADPNYPALRRAFPKATIALASSAGEITGTDVSDQGLSLLTLSFRHTRLRHRKVNTEDFPDSFAAGRALVKDLFEDDLKLVFILSDGGNVNGSELVKGIREELPATIPVTGGLAGDGDRFDYTLVGLNEAPRRGRIAAIALYGDQLLVTHGSCGGWEPFGLVRKVTSSQANELREIDGKNALEVYKRYLGKHADDLPGSALLFPLSIEVEGTDRYLVRTILSIDEERQSMIFAGDVPEGSKVRFMMANRDRLTEAASTAARQAVADADQRPEVALLVSCVGRKLVLGSRTEEEVEAVRNVFGPATAIAGFYSYGEISPLVDGGYCALHNQTMTITCLRETA